MLILYIIIICLIFPKTAWAYVDPGSISIFLQVIFAFVIGFFLAFRRMVGEKISSVYRWLTGKNKDLHNSKTDDN